MLHVLWTFCPPVAQITASQMDSSQIKQLLKPENSSSLVQTEWCNVPSWFELSSNTFSPCVAISFARSQSFFYCHTPTINCSLRNIGGSQMPQYQKESCLWQSKNWILHLRPNCLRVGGLASTERHFLVPRQFYPPLLNPGAVRECCLIRVAKFTIFEFLFDYFTTILNIFWLF